MILILMQLKHINGIFKPARFVFDIFSVFILLVFFRAEVALMLQNVKNVF